MWFKAYSVQRVVSASEPWKVKTLIHDLPFLSLHVRIAF